MTGVVESVNDRCGRSSWITVMVEGVNDRCGELNNRCGELNNMCGDNKVTNCLTFLSRRCHWRRRTEGDGGGGDSGENINKNGRKAGEARVNLELIALDDLLNLHYLLPHCLLLHAFSTTTQHKDTLQHSRDFHHLKPTQHYTHAVTPAGQLMPCPYTSREYRIPIGWPGCHVPRI